MLAWWQAIILGSIQGLTEFLPVSSSGHLILGEYLLGLPSLDLTFDILLHIGTLVAVIVFFGRELPRLIRQQWWLILVATLPAVVLGVLLKSYVESTRFNPATLAVEYFLSAGLLALGALMLYPGSQPKSLLLQTSRWLITSLEKIFGQPVAVPTTLQAFLVGLFQALAILPAVSRSGSTVSGGLIVGLSRESAFQFAFLISIPAVLGAVVFDLFDVVQSGEWQGLPWGVYALGVVASGLTGYLALFLLRWVMRQQKLWVFAIYCLFVGLALVLFA